MWENRFPVAAANRLINHLLLVPQSRIAAIENGDIGWTGWDTNATIQASQHDLIGILLAGLSQGVKAKDVMFPRPGGEPETETGPVFKDLADFIANEHKFNDFMFGKG